MSWSSWVSHGGAKLTQGYRLPARYVIHTVGPIWADGAAGEAELLASCHRRSLELAVAKGARSIAFPAVSTGVYGTPSQAAAGVAVATEREVVATHAVMDEVIFCCFSASDLALYERLLQSAT